MWTNFSQCSRTWKWKNKKAWNSNGLGKKVQKLDGASIYKRRFSTWIHHSLCYNETGKRTSKPEMTHQLLNIWSQHPFCQNIIYTLSGRIKEYGTSIWIGSEPSVNESEHDIFLGSCFCCDDTLQGTDCDCGCNFDYGFGAYTWQFYLSRPISPAFVSPAHAFLPFQQQYPF